MFVVTSSDCSGGRWFVQLVLCTSATAMVQNLWSAQDYFVTHTQLFKIYLFYFNSLPIIKSVSSI